MADPSASVAGTIPRNAPLDAALDQQALFALGLDHVRALSRQLWSDHNLHDPGITTLELLCFALTDLAYRAQFPVEDLLASAGDNAANMAAQFFTARRILPTRALTENDYRKLLIDLPGVKNAWILPAPLSCFVDPGGVGGPLLRRDDPGTPGVREVPLRGLYRVLVETMDGITTAAGRDAVTAAVRAVLQANRNLCEDFVGVDIVASTDYALCAEIELRHDADAATVAARLRFAVEQFLAPPVNNYALGEMLSHRHADGSPYTVAEIFAGPLLACGFIDDAELADAVLRDTIHLSDVIAVVGAVEGVAAVRDIIVNQLDDTGNPLPSPDKWRLAVPAGRRPRLSDAAGRIVFYKRNMPVAADPLQVRRQLDEFYGSLQAKLETPNHDDLPIPLGRWRNVAAYQSFQGHFPAVYGIGEIGLPGGAGEARRAQALQLKAYLLFFDQVMANYLAQLEQVRTLFSLQPELGHSYFAQLVESLPEYQRIYAPGMSSAALTDLGEAAAAAAARRNRFLDHLLARFAEDFHHYVEVMRAAFGGSAENDIAAKCAFLGDCDRLGAERGLAYDHSLTGAADLWNSANVSGLERRLARLLGMADWSRRNLGSVSYDTYSEIDATPGDEFRFRVRHAISNKILLSSSTHYTTPEAARTAMIRAIERAQLPEGYRREQSSDGKHYFNIVDGTGAVLARRIEYFPAVEPLEAAITALMLYLREHYGGEGMYLIENILLRPEQDGDPLLPLCADPGCAGCGDDDPYSYRLQVILPAYAGRFGNMDFRRFVEETIRQEMPAHIQPKVCWVNADDMAGLEAAYRDWLPLRAGVAHAERSKKLQNFIDALIAVKNVYPAQALFDCLSGGDKPHFILGRTALGSVAAPGT